jgi:hypothetical protein
MFFRLTVVGTIFCGGLIAGSTFYRIHNGKPILRPQFSELRFSETWRSGRSDRSLLARLVSANHILWVAVTKDTLHVSPHIPFNLAFFAEGFGWDHRVPGRTILEIRETEKNSFGTRVAIRYRHRTGAEELLELSVADGPGLLKALHEIQPR